MAHYRENGKKDVTTIINGAKTDEQMMNSLDKFILKYVCCPSKCPANEECTYPEMHLRVKKQKVTGECDACGFRGELDNQHKVAAFIVKNPPAGSDEPKVKDPSLGSPTKNSPVSNKLNGIA
jgi:translation initiation factor 5